MHGRDYVLPDDVTALARPVLAHRLLPSVEASMSGRTHHRDPRQRRGARCRSPTDSPADRPAE